MLWKNRFKQIFSKMSAAKLQLFLDRLITEITENNNKDVSAITDTSKKPYVT